MLWIKKCISIKNSVKFKGCNIEFKAITYLV